MSRFGKRNDHKQYVGTSDRTRQGPNNKFAINKVDLKVLVLLRFIRT
jgi:hypothetical protein